PPKKPPTKAQDIAFLSGGVVANTVLALVGILLWSSLNWGAAFWLTISAINTVQAVQSLIPHQYGFAGRCVASDGRQILQLLRPTPESKVLGSALLWLHLCRELWQAGGDRRIEAHYLRGAAATWGMLGDSQHAHELMREAEALGAQKWP